MTQTIMKTKHQTQTISQVLLIYQLYQEKFDEVTSQDSIVLNSQNVESNEKLIKFATLQEQLDLQYEGHENYGDKLVKVSG